MLPELNAAFTAVLETAANQYLKLAPESLDKLGQLPPLQRGLPRILEIPVAIRDNVDGGRSG